MTNRLRKLLRYATLVMWIGFGVANVVSGGAKIDSPSAAAGFAGAVFGGMPESWDVTITIASAAQALAGALLIVYRRRMVMLALGSCLLLSLVFLEIMKKRSGMSSCGCWGEYGESPVIAWCVLGLGMAAVLLEAIAPTTEDESRHP